jgi:peptidoglycan biosynthesis protein MviN/MurJ (putative lipid II flippase)
MNRVFLRIGIVLLALNIACGLTFVHFFGLNGLPLSTSVVYLVSVVLLNVALRDTVRLRPGDLGAMLVPFAFLLFCGLLIRALDLRLAPSESLGTLSGAMLLLMVFGGIGAWAAYRVWREPARQDEDTAFS